jgi:hypothetical protein
VDCAWRRPQAVRSLLHVGDTSASASQERAKVLAIVIMDGMATRRRIEEVRGRRRCRSDRMGLSRCSATGRRHWRCCSLEACSAPNGTITGWAVRSFTGQLRGCSSCLRWRRLRTREGGLGLLDDHRPESEPMQRRRRHSCACGSRTDGATRAQSWVADVDEEKVAAPVLIHRRLLDNLATMAGQNASS